MSNQVTPNRLQQATQELRDMNLGDFVIPDSFPAKGMDKYYICIGVKAKDSVDKMSKIYTAKKVTASINQWRKMERQVKVGLFKSMFGGVFGKLVMLHDPTIKPSPKKPKVLSPTHKSKVKELVESGKGTKEIAEELNIDIKRIEAYLNL